MAAVGKNPIPETLESNRAASQFDSIDLDGRVVLSSRRLGNSPLLSDTGPIQPQRKFHVLSPAKGAWLEYDANHVSLKLRRAASLDSIDLDGPSGLSEYEAASHVPRSF